MNRRSFLRSLSVATASLYLRIAPDAAASVPRAVSINPAWIDGEYEVSFILSNSSFQRVVPVKWQQHPRLPDPMIPLRFSVKDGVIIFEQ